MNFILMKPLRTPFTIRLLWSHIIIIFIKRRNQNEIPFILLTKLCIIYNLLSPFIETLSPTRLSSYRFSLFLRFHSHDDEILCSVFICTMHMFFVYGYRFETGVCERIYCVCGVESRDVCIFPLNFVHLKFLRMVWNRTEYGSWIWWKFKLNSSENLHLAIHCSVVMCSIFAIHGYGVTFIGLIQTNFLWGGVKVSIELPNVVGSNPLYIVYCIL